MACVYSTDDHIQCLNNLCRICGKRAQKKVDLRKKPIFCSDYVDGLYTVFGINVLEYDANCHPKKVCNICFTIMRNALSTRVDGVLRPLYVRGRERAITDSKLWTEHTGNNCEVCLNYCQQKLPGAKKKCKRGNPNLLKRKPESR